MATQEQGPKTNAVVTKLFLKFWTKSTDFRLFDWFQAYSDFEMNSNFSL